MNMGNIHLDFGEGQLHVSINGKYIGRILHTDNPCHNTHRYLKLQLQSYDTEAAREIFDLISQKLKKPLQVMLSSAETEIISFLRAAGFRRKRKCFEVEASAQDYAGALLNRALSCAGAGHPIYEKCCHLMLERYIATHKDISPWTGTEEDFFAGLPKCVFYEGNREEIRSFAFVEENEIAYVFGSDAQEFQVFSQALVTQLFAQNSTLVFEADDCDEYATILKDLFINQGDQSFDTYILN